MSSLTIKILLFIFLTLFLFNYVNCGCGKFSNSNLKNFLFAVPCISKGIKCVDTGIKDQKCCPGFKCDNSVCVKA